MQEKLQGMPCRAESGPGWLGSSDAGSRYWRLPVCGVVEPHEVLLLLTRALRTWARRGEALQARAGETTANFSRLQKTAHSQTAGSANRSAKMSKVQAPSLATRGAAIVEIEGGSRAGGFEDRASCVG